jgi:hypothetical protein
VDPVAAECVLDEATGVVTFCKDDDVWRETARHMLPRAVRYGQEVLDYFFRGKLDFEVYPSFENAGQVSLTFYNMSTDTMIGSFTLYTEDEQGKRVPVPGASVEGVTLSGTGMPDNPGPPENAMSNSYAITFPPNPDIKLRGLTLVFSGTLGAEEGAVVGKVKPWEPPILVIQEFAELTGPEQVERHDWCVESGGYLCEWDEEGRNTRFKDPRLQRASGHFTAPDGSDAGELIKRISLFTNGSLPAAQGIVLRLNGETVAGADWSRDKGTALVPKTWEVVVDLTQPADLPYVIGLPTLLVETHSGTQFWTTLVWWAQNKSVGEAWVQINNSCPRPRNVQVVSMAESWSQVEVWFGNEFIPVEGIGGFAVGTYNFTDWSLTDPRDSDGRPVDCPPEESHSGQGAAIFVSQFQLPTNSAEVFQGQSARRYLGESDPNVGKPPGPVPEAPPLVQELRFRRQYSPDEMQSYQLQGITPPEYEIELR